MCNILVLIAKLSHLLPYTATPTLLLSIPSLMTHLVISPTYFPVPTVLYLRALDIRVLYHSSSQVLNNYILEQCSIGSATT